MTAVWKAVFEAPTPERLEAEILNWTRSRRGGLADETPSVLLTGPRPGLPTEWRPGGFEEIWSEATVPARRIWAEIATRPDGYRYDELFAAVGLSGSDVGGSLSSIGAAIKRRARIWGLLPPPINRDERARLYRMNQVHANWVRRLAEGLHADQDEESSWFLSDQELRDRRVQT